MDNNIDVAKIMAEITCDVEKRYSEIEKQENASDRITQVSNDMASLNNELYHGVKARNHFLNGEIENLRSMTGIPWKLPFFEAKKPFIRSLYRFIARVILKLTRFITVQQNEVNNTVERSLGILQESTSSMADWSKIVDEKLHELTDTVNQAVERLNNQNHLSARFTDEMYFEFEKKYRGSEEEIKKKQDYYIQKYVLQNVSKEAVGIIVDLGCGRGEWLNLLEEHGYNGIGVDVNQEALKVCEYNGIKTVYMDVISYLKTLPSESVKLLTSFQLIEHLEMNQLLELFQETGRVMRKDGFIIFETPNPVNVNVGAASFYLDPTHKRPVHPQLLEFLAEQNGLTDIEFAYWQQESIHEWWDSIWKADTTDVKDSGIYRAMESVFMQSFWCSADYALIGRK